MLLAERVCVVCVKFSSPKFNLGKLNKLLGQGSRRNVAEFSEKILASGILEESCHAEYVCKTCEKKIKKGVEIKSLQPQEISYPFCETDCRPGSCHFDDLLSIFKNKKKSGQHFFFEESELPKIREIMGILQIHSFGSVGGTGLFKKLVLFRTQTNVMCCSECWYLAIKRPSSKNWEEPIHQCCPTDATRTVVLEEESFANSSTVSVATTSSCNEPLNQAILDLDLSNDSYSNENRESMGSTTNRKRLSDRQELRRSLSKRFKSDVCGQSFSYSTDLIDIDITCKKPINENNPQHKQSCNFRYGGKQTWSNDTTCRQRFINELLDLALSPKFQKDFFRILNRKLEKTTLIEDFTAQKSTMVSNVTVFKAEDVPIPVIAPNKYTRIVDLTQEKIRSLAGHYCSRRELRHQIKTIRSSGLRPPRNLHLKMAEERKILLNQMEAEDFENSFIVRWTSNGLLDYLNR